MDSNTNNSHDHAKVCSKDIMRRFIDSFRNNDMLNQFFRVEHRQREYKIYCSNDNFVVYRVNPDPGIPPGFPGWITCMVTHQQIVDYSATAEIDSGDPNVHDWLDCIANGNINHI